jgi:hypothetical protein
MRYVTLGASLAAAAAGIFRGIGGAAIVGGQAIFADASHERWAVRRYNRIARSGSKVGENFKGDGFDQARIDAAQAKRDRKAAKRAAAAGAS